MRKMFLSALGIAVAGAMASQASAAVSISFVNVGTPKVTVGLSADSLMNGWTGYIIRLTSDSGSIQSYDFGAANNGSITGNLAQRFSDSDSDGVIDPTPGPLGQNNSALNQVNNADSHFLGSPATIIIPAGKASPTENLTGSASVNPFASKSNDTTTYGVGTLLSGAGGIDVSIQSSTFDVAYIVVPTGTAISFANAQVSTANGTFVVSGSSAAPVPEPASLGVLAVGGLALLARRRKA